MRPGYLYAVSGGKKLLLLFILLADKIILYPTQYSLIYTTPNLIVS